MARSCGIHIDQRHFHLVALEGSAKKHKLLLRASGTIPLDQDPVEAVASQLRELIKSSKLNIDNAGLAVDSGLAAFRRLTVPFDDAEKTEEIIKFEIEGDLPQWDIDDVIVDFHVLASTPGVESHLLVTALPKARLERQLLACERGNIEADEAELDGTALFNAASSAEVTGPGSAQVLVYVGDSTTTVVVVDDGRLVSMRAIRIGALPVGPSVFDQVKERPEDEDDEAEEASAAPSAEAAPEPPSTVLQPQTIARIRREIGRTLEGAQTEHEIEAIYLTGYPVLGLGDEPLQEIPFLPLEVFPADAEPLENSGLLTVAYGAALRALGGGKLKPRLRREELRFTGTFERLELPLAVLGLLLCTLLGVMAIVLHKRIGWRDAGTPGDPGDMALWMNSGVTALLGDSKEGIPARLTDPPKRVKDYALRAVSGDGGTITKYNQIRLLNQMLSDEIKRLKVKVGEITNEEPPQSALQGGLLVLESLYSQRDDLGRFSIRSFDAKYERGSGAKREEQVVVTLDMDFFAGSEALASSNFAKFRTQLLSEPWCLDFPDKKSDPFQEEGGGLAYRGLVIKVDVAQYLADQLAARLAAQEVASQ